MRLGDEPARMALLGIGVCVLVLERLAWWLTGSVALLSDALETIVNVAASLLAYGSLRVAAHPADARHPYAITRQNVVPRWSRASSSSLHH